MNILEKTLEDIVFETDNETLYQRGLLIEGKKKRQVRIGNYGIADIVSVHREHYGPCITVLVITITELKQLKVGMTAFLQAIRYAKGIDRYLSEVRKVKYSYKFRINLIGTDIDLGNEAFVYLSDLISNFDSTQPGIGLVCYVMKINIDGVQFVEKDGFCLNNEGF